MILSCEEALADVRVQREVCDWRPEWFPVLEMGVVIFLFVDCSRSMNGVAPVSGYLRGFPDVEDEYASLESMLATLADSFDEGAFVEEPDGFLEVDEEKSVTIARRHNPGVAYWWS